MRTRTTLAVAIWAVPAALLACGKDGEGDGTFPSDDELQFVSLASQEIADTGSFTADLTVDVPDGASSVMAYCGKYGDAALGQVWNVTDPSGGAFWDGDAPGSGGFRAEYLDDMAPTVIPISPETAVSPGTWTFRWWVDVGSDGSADCGAVIRLDEPGDEATIAVDLVFVGLDGLDASTAPDDASFQEALAQLDAEWASAGLTPLYTYIDFGGDASRFAVVDVTDDDYSEFNDLLRTANPESKRRITFFLVQEIANGSAGGATILGLSAGPPGAAATSGTSKSGVIVSAVDVGTAPGDVGKIMAHEGGHFLGLYHTTEKDGSQFDPIGDSPECPPSNDGDGNGTMNTAECGGKGAENVMWWTLTEGTASFSADQGWVVRHNPVAD